MRGKKTLVYVGVVLFNLVLYQAQAIILDTSVGADIDKALFISTMPTIGSFERAKGAVKFDAGFSCTSDPTDSSGTNAPEVGVNFSVRNTIDLSQGSMKLTDDMYLASGGHILGANSLQTLANAKGCIYLNGKTLFLEDNLTLTSGFLCFPDSGVIDGQGHEIILEGGNLNFNLLGVSHKIVLRNLVIKNPTHASPVAGSIFFGTPQNNFIHTIVDTFEMDNVTIKLPFSEQVPFGFPKESFALISPVNVKNLFTIEGRLGTIFFNQVITIEKFSRVHLKEDTTPRMSTSASLFVFTDKTSEILFDNSLFIPVLFNYVFTKGTMIIEGVCTFVFDSGNIIFGDFTDAGDFDIIIRPGAQINCASIGVFNRGFFYRNPT